MLNERQLSLLDKLENQNFTLAELARGLNVSSRTILRDIDYLNFTLSGAARITAQSAGYQLDIHDRTHYFRQLQRHDNDDRMLLMLLTNLYTTRAQLAEALNLPEAMVNDRLSRLKLRYERWFTITSKPNAGHFVDEPRHKKLIILANLVKKDPLTACEYLGLDAAVFTTLQSKISHNAEYTATLLLAVYALRNVDQKLSAGKSGETFLAAFDAADLYLPDSSLIEAGALACALESSAAQVDKKRVGAWVHELWAGYGLGENDEQLVDDLTAHITRCAANPMWLQESRQGSMNNLKAAWPVAFDLSISLIKQIKERLDIEIYDSDLIGLYFACALERHYVELHTIVLVATQNAIATINQLAIERELPDCRVVIVRSSAEFAAVCEEVAPVLVINNSQHALESGCVENLAIKNIITPAGIGLIKEKLEHALIKQKLPQLIPAELSLLYANQTGENWLLVIGGICAQLVDKGLLNHEDAQRVYQRETEGENLVVNHLAIPHCWSESSDRFRGYFVRLAHPVVVNNETVRHLLLACTSTAARQESKIFSYLANVLNGCDAQTIGGINSYEDFMALLE